MWQHKFDKFCRYTGSCRRLNNGNTLIGYFNCYDELANTQQENDCEECISRFLMHNYVIEVDANANANVINKLIIPWGATPTGASGKTQLM